MKARVMWQENDNFRVWYMDRYECGFEPGAYIHMSNRLELDCPTL